MILNYKEGENMKEYIIYRCKVCGGSFIFPKNEVKLNEDKGNFFLACCGE